MRRAVARNLIGVAGIFVLMAVAWLHSANRRVVNWRVVLALPTIVFFAALMAVLHHAGVMPRTGDSIVFGR